jgi:putative addiction module component (TIGR02574 family)
MGDPINREIYDRMSVPDKIRLVQDIWDDIARKPDQVEVSRAQVEEAERRLEEHLKNPGEAIAWEEARRRIENGE